MSNYSFSEAQRWAIYSTYGQVCYLCRRPVTFQTMEVDHILPEHLSKAPEQLKSILKQYGLPDDFDLNDYGNWLPACSPCNSTKLGTVFEPTLIFQAHLTNARVKAEKARKAEQESISDRSLARAIGVVIRADQKIPIASDHIEKLVNHLFAHDSELKQRAMHSLRSRQQPPDTMSLILAPLKLDFTPFYSVVFESGTIRIVQTPYGTGYQPVGDNHDSSFRCGHCGALGPWSGPRCLTCGYLSDD